MTDFLDELKQRLMARRDERQRLMGQLKQVDAEEGALRVLLEAEERRRQEENARAVMEPLDLTIDEEDDILDLESEPEPERLAPPITLSGGGLATSGLGLTGGGLAMPGTVVPSSGVAATNALIGNAVKRAPYSTFAMSHPAATSELRMGVLEELQSGERRHFSQIALGMQVKGHVPPSNSKFGRSLMGTLMSLKNQGVIQSPEEGIWQLAE